MKMREGVFFLGPEDTVKGPQERSKAPEETGQ